MKDSLKNTFPIDGKKAYGLYEPEIIFPLPRMEDLLKNTSALFGKTASSGRRIENGPLAGKHFPVKTDSS